MPRKKKVNAAPSTVPATSAAALKLRIQELQQELERTAAEERRRRGELMNDYLDGPQGEKLRAVISELVAPSDRYLFGLDVPPEPQTSASVAATEDAEE